MTEYAREYVDARGVLLDALVGLQPHLDAFVLVGQAVYLRPIDRIPGYQPFTTDVDLAFDPSRLADTPLLAEAMESAGFAFSGQPGVWHRTVTRPGEPDVTIPVDLIVPEHIAPAAGRRGARLPGGHGKTAAQKTVGVEGALVDHDPIEIHALDPLDQRDPIVNVAGQQRCSLRKPSSSANGCTHRAACCRRMPATSSASTTPATSTTWRPA